MNKTTKSLEVASHPYFDKRLLTHPNTLYNLATTTVMQNYTKLRPGLELCKEDTIFDVIFQVFKQNKLDLLSSELSHLQTFTKLLKIGDKRADLHKMLGATTVEIEMKKNVPNILAEAFFTEVDSILSKLCSKKLKMSSTNTTLDLGFNLGGFLCEAGWYSAGPTVCRACANLMRYLDPDEPNFTSVKLECLTWLLHSMNSNYQVREASSVYSELYNVIQDNEVTIKTLPNLHLPRV